jgi:hypothetical protein
VSLVALGVPKVTDEVFAYALAALTDGTDIRCQSLKPCPSARQLISDDDGIERGGQTDHDHDQQ